MSYQTTGKVWFYPPGEIFTGGAVARYAGQKVQVRSGKMDKRLLVCADDGWLAWVDRSMLDAPQLSLI